MMTPLKINPVVVVGVPTLLDHPLSWEWSDFYMGLQFPLGTSMCRVRIGKKYVDEARNEIVAAALDMNADYVLFISDDVLAPARTFELLWRHRKHIVTGVYWTKNNPTLPYLWNGLMRGPHTEWTYGDFFKVDWAGCDCLLVSTEVFRKMKQPWFSRDWNYNVSNTPAFLATEDLYFYTKARELGFELFCDTAVQCDHQDRSTGLRYGLTQEMPQYLKREKWERGLAGKLIADLGCYKTISYFDHDCKVIRIDHDPTVAPDMLCDLRGIPVVDEHFDVVHARHVLEHFSFLELPAVLKEWLRILKVGGELILNVPNLAFAAKEILKADEDQAYDATYGFWQTYGRQENDAEGEAHKHGFIKRSLERLLAQFPALTQVRVETVDDGMNLQARAVKGESTKPFAIVPAWERLLDGVSRNGNGAVKLEIVVEPEPEFIGAKHG